MLSEPVDKYGFQKPICQIALRLQDERISADYPT